MKKPAIILVLALSGCMQTQPAATFKPVDYPTEPAADWVISGQHVEKPAGPVEFKEEPGVVVDIRVTASPEDFYGSKLYDGFDFLLQPVDTQDRPVKKLGSMKATLYRFDPDSYSGKGEKLIEWDVPAARMAHLWVEKGIDRGFRMKLAWDRRPMVADVKLEVEFDSESAKTTFTKVISAGSVEQPRYRWLEK